jgi:hypothetical protein
MLITDRTHHKGHIAGVPAVDDSAQLFGMLQKGVGLVDKQRRLPLLDGSE